MMDFILKNELNEDRVILQSDIPFYELETVIKKCKDHENYKDSYFCEVVELIQDEIIKLDYICSIIDLTELEVIEC